jgi:hypothetical protein
VYAPREANFRQRRCCARTEGHPARSGYSTR